MFVSCQLGLISLPVTSTPTAADKSGAEFVPVTDYVTVTEAPKAPAPSGYHDSAWSDYDPLTRFIVANYSTGCAP